MSALPGIRRIVRNALRLPSRTWRTLRRRLNPEFDLERQAKAVPGWFAPDYLAQLDGIPGMCAARVGWLLASLATQAPPGGVIVEIGAWKGRITAWLVEASERRPDRPPVVSIDPHSGQLGESWDDFCRTVADFNLAERGLQIVRASSHVVAQTWSRPISLLWIDGSHDYEDVALDIADYTSHVVAGGIVAFDDSAGGAFPGVERAIAEWSATSGNFQRIATLRETSIFRKLR